MSLRRIVEVAVTVAGAIWLVAYLYAERALLAAALTGRANEIALLLVLVVLGWWVAAAQGIVLLRSQGVRMSAVESLLVHAATALLNYVPMRLGTLLRFRYLKSVHGLGYARNLGLVALRLAFLVGVSAIAVAAGAVALGGAGRTVAHWPLLAGLAALFAATAVGVLAIRPGGASRAAGRLWNAFAEAVREGRRRRDCMALLLVLIVAQLALGGLRMHLALQIAGVPADLGMVLIVAPVAVLLGIFSFASLGLREALIGVLVAATGAGFDQGVIAASAERGTLILASIVLGSIGTVTMLRRMRRTATTPVP